MAGKSILSDITESYLRTFDCIILSDPIYCITKTTNDFVTQDQ